MHTNEFKTAIAAACIHEHVFEVAAVLQEVLPTLAPASFVISKDSVVHDLPNVFKGAWVDVVLDCNV